MVASYGACAISSGAAANMTTAMASNPIDQRPVIGLILS